MLSRLVLGLYLGSLLLLPWGWFPPFPWLHEHAQWSDALFAATAALWAIEQGWTGRWPRLRAVHVAVALYGTAAALSLLLAAEARWVGLGKLLGIAELGMLMVITSDLASRPGVPAAIARVTAITALALAAAALGGLLLFYLGVPTRLIGEYGDLQPSPWYARVQAGTIHPHMLASYCIFAAAVVARPDADLPRGLRRLAQAALAITVLLTFSRALLGFGLAAALRTQAAERSRGLAASLVLAAALLMLSMSCFTLEMDPTRPLAARFDTTQAPRHWHTVASSLQTVVRNPLSGSGVVTPPAQVQGARFDAHLTPLNIAATLGLPALAAFMGLVLILWRARARPLDRATWSGLAGMAVDGLGSDIEDFRHLWVLFGLADARSSREPSACPVPARAGHPRSAGALVKECGDSRA